MIYYIKNSVELGQRGGGAGDAIRASGKCAATRCWAMANVHQRTCVNVAWCTELLVCY
jgi:hypothetical protein